MRKILLLFLLLATNCTAPKPIIFWDLHGVLLEQENPIKSIIDYPKLGNVISHLSWPLIKDFIRTGWRYIFQDISSEEYLAIAPSHNNPYLFELILRIANAQHPLPTMDSLVHELASHNYEQYIASNIGPTAFIQLIDPKRYPALVPLFTHLNVPAAQITQIEDGSYLKKPNPRYFTDLLQRHTLDPSIQHIIFIDDNKKNVSVARSLGFDAIHFKHPHQLRTQLRLRGVAIAKPPFSLSNQWNTHALYKQTDFNQKKYVD